MKQEDFQIFENGQRQELSHFSIQAISGATPQGVQLPMLRSVLVLEPAPPGARTFLILLGRGMHQTVSKGVDALIGWVRNALLPQDRLAVFAFNRATDFTTDHELVAQVLERYRTDGEWIEAALESRARGLDSIFGSRDMPKALQTRIGRPCACSSGRPPIRSSCCRESLVPF